jgi:hypothetical protein
MRTRPGARSPAYRRRVQLCGTNSLRNRGVRQNASYQVARSAADLPANETAMVPAKGVPDQVSVGRPRVPCRGLLGDSARGKEMWLGSRTRVVCDSILLASSNGPVLAGREVAPSG